MDKIESFYREYTENRAEQGLKRELIDITSLKNGNLSFKNKDYINFSSNDYLGFSQHPDLIERTQEWAKKYGAGSGASRLVTGNLDVYSQIEDKVAKFKDKEAALIMASGFQANSSILPALFDKKILSAEPLVFSDKLNHASMHHGCITAGVKQMRYHHNDMGHLSELLEKHSSNPQPKFILTESVFSMDGDIAPLDKIYKLAQQHDCFVIVDEAHATGVLGEHGKGLADKADLIIGTFSKAMGSFGAYIACSQNIKDYLINKCNGFIYSTALPPAVFGAIDMALDIVPTMDKEREYLQNLAQVFRNNISALGLSCGQSQTQIIPLIIGNAHDALNLSNKLKENGIWATAIRPPTVPAHTARIRFALSSLHSEDHIEKVLNILKTIKVKKAA